MTAKFIFRFSLLITCVLCIVSAKADTLTFSRSFGNFQKAVSVSIGRGEFVFISDAATNQVFKYGKDGKELARFGGSGFGSSELNSPLCIDASNGLDVFVCDNMNNRIQRLDYKLNFAASFDFNQYNNTADNSKKIFYPLGVTSLSTGDLVVISNSSEFKGAVLTQFSDITIYFGSNFGFDRISQPAKVVRGKELDVWILDRESSDIMNFTSSGTFVKKLKAPNSDKVISLYPFDNKLYILTAKNIIAYELKSEKYVTYDSYSIDALEKINDFAILDSGIYLLLANNKVYEYKLTN
jgi:hypothetical protein